MSTLLPNIAVIGAGQLGSRHLQGLTKSTKQFQVYVVDPDIKALDVANLRYKEASDSSQTNKVSYHQNIDEMPDTIDVAIIATTANVRRSSIENLLEQRKVKYMILEKIVFQKSDDFLPIQFLLSKVGTKTWVNCARRSYPFYQELKEEINDEIISIRVEGNNWGIACNTIHMIDLLVFITGQTDLSFDSSNLDKKIYSSKRDGYQELKGMFMVKSCRGDILEIVDQEPYTNGDLDIIIRTDKVEISINENKGLLIRNLLNSTIEKSNIKIPFQSEITGQLLDQILNTGKSDLTLYDECMQYHIPMLDAFNEHFSKVAGKTVKTCPIT